MQWIAHRAPLLHEAEAHLDRFEFHDDAAIQPFVAGQISDRAREEEVDDEFIADHENDDAFLEGGRQAWLRDPDTAEWTDEWRERRLNWQLHNYMFRRVQPFVADADEPWVVAMPHDHNPGFRQRGVQILFLSRPQPITEFHLPQPRSILSISRDNFRNITRTLGIHSHIVRVLGDNDTRMSVEPFEVEPPLRFARQRTAITALCALKTEAFDETLGLASVYSVLFQSNCGIFFGCTARDMQQANDMLLDPELELGGGWHHPLLLVSVFLELQLSRVRRQTAGLSDSAIRLSRDAKGIAARSWSRSHRLLMLDLRARRMRETSTILQTDIAAVQRELAVILLHAKSLQAQDVPPDQDLTRRFIARFDEMDRLYQDAAGSSSVDAESAVQTAQVIVNDIIRRQQKAAIGLAFAALVYLPASTIATIFAMPVFDFKAQWRDFYGNAADSGDDKCCATNNTSDKLNVGRLVMHCPTQTTVLETVSVIISGTLPSTSPTSVRFKLDDDNNSNIDVNRLRGVNTIIYRLSRRGEYRNPRCRLLVPGSLPRRLFRFDMDDS
ncbi:hypothetical protein OQA88_9351 [Cercophora sp. LCS_1]